MKKAIALKCSRDAKGKPGKAGTRLLSEMAGICCDPKQHSAKTHQCGSACRQTGRMQGLTTSLVEFPGRFSIITRRKLKDSLIQAADGWKEVLA